MATVSTPLKTVKFKLPSESPASNSQEGTPHRLTSPPPPPTVAPSPPASDGARRKAATPPSLSDSQSDITARLARAETAHRKLVVEDVEGEIPRGERKNSPYKKQRPQSRPGSDVQAILKQQQHLSGPLVARDRSPRTDSLGERERGSTAQVASQLRERTNSASHKHVRSVKFEVAQMREHLLKVEEEIKQLSRSKRTLELSIQDLRKALSVNQQSLSTQQKKTSRGDEDMSVRLLREEAQILSKAKHSVEHQLQTAKSQLQSLDATRKTLRARISTASQTLGLDAQSFKVYDGPVAVRSDAVSRQRNYRCGYSTRDSSSTAGQQCAQAVGTISASRTLREEIKSLIVSVHSKKMETHEKISAAIAKSVEDAKAHKRDILLEKGQVRLAQNSMLHRKHSEEIALGIALGPVSEKHRSVSECSSRPLSRVRPISATEERANLKETTKKLTRQLSATTTRASQMGQTEKRLSQRVRESSQSAVLDTTTLRIRKISLDNRWVQ